MNSAEKKSPEPSMDDIISSIRNIISDEPQESLPVPADDTPVPADPPVVQLTENQIAEPVESADFSDPVVEPTLAPVQQQPVQSQAVEPEPVQPQPVDVQAVATSPAPAPAPAVASPQEIVPSPVEPIIGTPLTGDEIASEIAAVPGVLVAGNDMPSTEPSLSKVPPLAAPIVPELAPLPTRLAEAEATAPVEPAAAGLAAHTDDLPLTTEAPNSAPARVDTIEDLLRGSRTPGFEETVEPANDVEPEPVAQAAQLEPVSKGEINEPEDLQEPTIAEEIVETRPEDLPVSEKPMDVAPVAVAPVVLDASKVTPEDAVAISAVAAATSEALAGTSAPAEAKEGCGSLEDSIKAMLKPMIRDWLDDNMPRILEGAIKEEVKGSGSDES